ncbi:MAG: hydrogenase maturation protease [Deltaproteobacteria bacterium]|nr:hydrogenase maturation protease [Deltaproteobacteria bacterium]
MAEENITPSVLIFGCGNVLRGDDGLGPAVVKRLQEHYELPEGVLALDVGTGLREALLDLMLSGHQPRQIIIVDAMDLPGQLPGEVREIALEDLPVSYTANFSLHQFPSVNMLKELRACTGATLTLLAVQVGESRGDIRETLSPPVADAVDTVCRLILRNI